MIGAEQTVGTVSSIDIANHDKKKPIRKVGEKSWGKQSGGNSLEETVWRKKFGGKSLEEKV
jgi:hypothetical protein